VAGCHECSDEPSGSGAMELVSYLHLITTAAKNIFTRKCMKSSDIYLDL
jgi:hypothetical protein